MHQIRMGVVREYRKAQGFFDGRYVSREQDSKKKYRRKRRQGEGTFGSKRVRVSFGRKTIDGTTIHSDLGRV